MAGVVGEGIGVRELVGMSVISRSDQGNYCIRNAL